MEDAKSSPRKSAIIAGIVGKRMKEAREVFDIPAGTAAAAIGIRMHDLLKIEDGVRPANLSIVASASEVYEVSADYLMGLSDNWDRDDKSLARNQTSKWLLSYYDSIRNRDLACLSALNKRVNACTEAIAGLAQASREAWDAFEDMVMRNPEFEDMPLGAKVSHRVTAAKIKGDAAMDVLKALRNEAIKPADQQ